MAEPGSPAEVLIVRGGAAALETPMALDDVAGARVRVTLAAPEGFADLEVPLETIEATPVGR